MPIYNINSKLKEFILTVNSYFDLYIFSRITHIPLTNRKYCNKYDYLLGKVTKRTFCSILDENLHTKRSNSLCY